MKAFFAQQSLYKFILFYCCFFLFNYICYTYFIYIFSLKSKSLQILDIIF